MPGRLYLFQWDPAAAEARAAELRAAGWTVEVESTDGGRGTRNILNNPPDIILFDLARRPGQSRITADNIRGFKATRQVPMLFIDGTEEDVAKVRARILKPLFSPSELLMHRLSKLDD